MSSASVMNVESFDVVTSGYDPFYGVIMFFGFVSQYYQQNLYSVVLQFYVLISTEYVLSATWFGTLLPNTPLYLYLNQEIATTRLLEPVLFGIFGAAIASPFARLAVGFYDSGTALPHPMYTGKSWKESMAVLVDIFYRPFAPENLRIWIFLVMGLSYYVLSGIWIQITSGAFFSEDNNVLIYGVNVPFGSLFQLLAWGPGWTVLFAMLTWPVRPGWLAQKYDFLKFYGAILAVHTVIFIFVVVHMGSTFFQLLFSAFVAIPLLGTVSIYTFSDA